MRLSWRSAAARIGDSKVGESAPATNEKIEASTPTGSIDHPLNPISLALGAGATFIARAADTDAKLMGVILQEAYKHKGAVFIEMLRKNGFTDKELDVMTRQNPARLLGLPLQAR